MLVIASLLCVFTDSGGAVGGDTIRIGGGSDDDISDDGRFVAFAGGGINVRDRDTDEDGIFDEAGDISTDRVDVDGSGVPANGFSSSPAISDNGRYITFESSATNLVPNDTNNAYDIFLHDRATHVTRRVSVSSSGTQADDDSRYDTSISSDGRFVAFPSEASNLVPGDTNDFWDFYVRDRDTDEDEIFDEAGEVSTERVNVDDAGNQASPSGVTVATSISPNGRYVGFTTIASNLVPGDTNGAKDVFVRDLKTGTIERASLDSLGNQGNRDAYSSPSISDDGHVAFSSDATNMIPNDTNGKIDVFVHDLRTGATQRASVGNSGTQGDDLSGYFVSISSDGCAVTFDSSATNLVPGDTNGVRDVFVHDLHTRSTERASVDSTGIQGNGLSYRPAISAAGRFVSFASSATNLVAGETNGLGGVFVHEQAPIQPTDCIAPTTSASATTRGGGYTSGAWTNEEVAVTLIARDEGGSGVGEIRYSATGADAFPEQSVGAADMPATFTIDAEGTTTIRYSATDNDGNAESPKTFTVNIDRSAPDTYITSGPSGPTDETIPTFSFDGSDNLTASAGLLFSHKVVAGSVAPESVSWSEYSSNKSATLGGATGLAQGSYTFYVKAKDQGGNEDASPTQRSFTVDTTAPTVDSTTPLNRATAVGRGTNLTATFSERMDPSTLGASTFKLYRINPDGSQTRIADVVVGLSSDGLKATLNPFGTKKTLLAMNTRYKGVVTLGARDLAGNPLARNKSWTFTTR